ncbi:YqaJ viral recombinase family nuclease [Paenibacillus glycanilyticus]|uniref:YqaJ viral recombinase family nuclease n=1 Tax=Paenibacillus glycanilyticus TaxID=126569 RepID=UPI00190FE4C1|nr:YqaJ viral recombinase family protein [Paenibacillus glycanilyticus]
MSYEILASTVSMSRKDWLKIRQTGLGGSDASAVAGLNRYRSPLSVYFDKVQGEPVTEENEFMYWGNTLEEIVAAEFSKRSGLKVRRKNAILQSKEFPFMLANVDRMVVGADEGLECKTASAYKSGEWSNEKIPWEYELQCHHYMAVTGFSAWWIAVLIGGNQFIYKRVPRDQAIIDQLTAIEEAFWKEYVIPQIPPAADGSAGSTETLKALYPSSNGIEIHLSSEVEKWVLQRDEADETLEAAQERKDEAENRLKALLGENEVGRWRDIKVTWKNSISSRIDTKRLKAERPEIFVEYAKESNSRRFSIKKEVM